MRRADTRKVTSSFCFRKPRRDLLHFRRDAACCNMAPMPTLLSLLAPLCLLQSVEYRSPAGVEYRAQRDTGAIARAESALAADPRNVEKIIALGVAQSGVRQYREANARNAYAQRLRLYRGEVSADSVFTPADTSDIQVATLSYGIGNWYLVQGDTAKARTWFERSVASGGWPAFGFIVSEVELRSSRAHGGYFCLHDDVQ